MALTYSNVHDDATAFKVCEFTKTQKSKSLEKGTFLFRSKNSLINN